MSDATMYVVIGVFSAASLLATVAMLPRLLAELPHDFLHNDHPWRPTAHPIRNLLGALLILAGLAMLVLPGQGVLSIIAGLALTTVPGKDRAMRWLMRSDTVLRAVNALRRRVGAPALTRGDPAPDQ